MHMHNFLSYHVHVHVYAHLCMYMDKHVHMYMHRAVGAHDYLCECANVLREDLSSWLAEDCRFVVRQCACLEEFHGLRIHLHGFGNALRKRS